MNDLLSPMLTKSMRLLFRQRSLKSPVNLGGLSRDSLWNLAHTHQYPLESFQLLTFDPGSLSQVLVVTLVVMSEKWIMIPAVSGKCVCAQLC